MKIFSFDRHTGIPIEEHGSAEATISKLTNLNAPASIRCLYLNNNGLLGSHPAKSPQLFLVVQGEGYLRGEGAIRTPIRAGQAVYWDRGEWHEASTDSGMTAIVIESEELDPGLFMAEV
jgi:quercetin dioxygenase-like cupin family protein